MDVCEMNFKGESFDVVIDKGFIIFKKIELYFKSILF